LTLEFERERENLLETIRESSREIRLWEQVVSLLLSQKTINKIWEKAVWDDDLEEWRLPRIRSKGSASAKQNKLPTIGISVAGESNLGNLQNQLGP
jgi:hypothetical protein